MAVTKEFFGKSKDGRDAYAYTLTNGNGMKAVVTDFGAILLNLYVPDNKGELRDIVLGFDRIEGYFDNPSFFGALIGPTANRIKDATFSIDGITYHIPVNDNANNLHSDYHEGYHKRLWNAEVLEDGVLFTIESKDGELGFPGNRKASVIYRLTEDNELKLIYHGSSDKKTLFNMTNHSYFNLKGQGEGNIHDHVLWIDADFYTPVVEGAIPTGEIVTVKNTVFDFTSPKEVGRDIEADEHQLKLVQGYDHNYVINNYDGSLKKIACVEAGGRKMEVYTDLPGVQFYAGNCIAPEDGKGGVRYGRRSGLCLETQVFPNSANEPGFPNTVFGEGKDYDTVTIYRFPV